MLSNQLKSIVILLVIPVVLFSQNNKFSHWSVLADYGYLFYDGDVNSDYKGPFPSKLTNQVIGLNVSYSIDPIWGLELSGSLFPIKGKSVGIVPLYINTNVYNVDFSGAINLSKLIFPDTRAKLQLLGGVGFGTGVYTYDVRNLADMSAITASQTYVDENYNGQVRSVAILNGTNIKKSDFAISFPLYVALEYNLNKPLSLGLRLNYRVYNKDNLEGVTYLSDVGSKTDEAGFGSVYLRYKIGATKTEHVRNITMEEYRPDKALVQIEKMKKDISGIKVRIDSVESKVNDMAPRLEKVEAMIQNVGPDSDNDGVIDIRDQEPNTPTGTVVDFNGKAMLNFVENVQKAKSTGPGAAIAAMYDVPTVYFEFDRVNLNDQALIVIKKVANAMKNDSTLMVEVRGFTDNSGDKVYNDKLSLHRAERVKEELVKIWNITENRIIANGKGQVAHPQALYSPNRCCEFYFNKEIGTTPQK